MRLDTVAIRTARSRISNGYLPGHRCCDMAPSVMVNRFPGACQIDKGASDSPAMSGRKPLPVRTSTNWQFRGAGLRATEALPWRGAGLRKNSAANPSCVGRTRNWGDAVFCCPYRGVHFDR